MKMSHRMVKAACDRLISEKVSEAAPIANSITATS